MRNKIKKETLSALLTAVSLSLFAVELLIPPFPFAPAAKIGLANIVTLFMLTNRNFFSSSDCFKVLIARCVLSSLITGRIASVFFSLVGGIFAVLGMLATVRITDSEHVILTSIVGAIFHNIGQMTVAFFIYGTLSIAYYLPALFLTGVLCGILTGICVVIINKTKIVDLLKF